MPPCVISHWSLRSEPRLSPVTLESSQGSDEVDHVTALKSRIVSALRAHRAPAIGFVNEGKLAMDERRDVNNTPIEKYEQDILDGEPVTMNLMGQPKLTAEPDAPKWVIDLYRQR